MPDDLGDRMKLYEQAEAGRKLMPLLPALARLDGKCFSGFTRDLARPFDRRMADLMISTTRHLVEMSGASCGYTQSDEISLAWLPDRFDAQIYFDGKIQKMASVLAASASVHFNRHLADVIPEKAGYSPVFDCRVWNVPNAVEGANAFLWREQDATKNSILSSGYSVFSRAEMHGKDTKVVREMLFGAGINWNDYPATFKRGAYLQRKAVARRYTTEELAALPPKHDARIDPDLIVVRSDVVLLTLPKLLSVKNRADVIFCGADPDVVESKIMEAAR